MKREKFSSRLGFILISAGCAIGLGNVWRFPYISGKYGGAAFVLIYLFFLAILGLPIMVMEFAVGRASQKSIATSFNVLEKKGSKWHVYRYFGMAGNYLLCMSGSLTLTKGDALILLGALFFSFHILVVDYFSSKVSGVKLSCIQLFIASMLSAIPMFVLENPKLSSICAAWAPILYAGILSCGVAYTLQIIGQRNLNPTIASLILSLESVISVLAGWVILHQTLSTRELIGCVLMFAAILLAEL